MSLFYLIFDRKISRSKRIEHNTSVVTYSVVWALVTILLIIYLTLHIKYKFLIDLEYIIQNCLCYIAGYDNVTSEFSMESAVITDIIGTYLNLTEERYYDDKLLSYMYWDSILIKWVIYLSFIYTYNTLFVKGPLTWSKQLYFEDNVVNKRVIAFKIFNLEVNTQFVFWLFVITEILLFVTLFWVLLQSQALPSNSLGNKWPPEKIPIMDPYSIPLLNTFLLITSGITLMWVHHLKRNKRKK